MKDHMSVIYWETIKQAMRQVSLHCLESPGIHDELINKGLKDVTLISMRTEMMKHKSALILFDAYKSSPKKAYRPSLELLWPLRHITTPRQCWQTCTNQAKALRNTNENGKSP